MVTQAPCVITVCADVHRFSMCCEQRDAEPCYDNFEMCIRDRLSLFGAFSVIDTVGFLHAFDPVSYTHLVFGRVFRQQVGGEVVTVLR